MVFNTQSWACQELLVSVDANVQKILDEFAASPSTVTELIQSLKVPRQQDRVAIAKGLADANPVALSNHIGDFEIADENDRFEIALIAAKQNAFTVAYNWDGFGISTERNHIRMADVVIENGGSYIWFSKHFAIQDPTEKRRLLFKAARTPGNHFVRDIDSYESTDSATLMEALRVAFESDAEASLSAASLGAADTLLNLIGVHRFAELLKVGTQASGTYIYRVIRNISVENQSDRAELARISLRADVAKTLAEISLFGLEGEHFRSVLEFAASLDGEVYARWTASFPYFLESAFRIAAQNVAEKNRAKADLFAAETANFIKGRSGPPASPANASIARQILGQHLGASYAKWLAKLHGQSVSDGDDDGNEEDDEDHLKWSTTRRLLLSDFPDLNVDQLDALNGSVKRVEVLHQLVGTYIQAHSGRDTPPQILNQTAFFFWVTGLPDFWIQPFLKLSLTQQSDLMDITLSLTRGLPRQALRSIQFAPSLLESKNTENILTFFRVLRDNINLSAQQTSSSANEFFEIVHQSAKPLSTQNIEHVTEILTQRLVAQIQSVFASESFTFRHQDMENLRQSWGDIDFVYTLLARYQGSSQWREEIPALGQIFEAVLNQQFADFKFRGLTLQDQALVAAQLRAVDIKEWAKPRTIIQVVTPESKTVEEESAQKKNAIASDINSLLWVASPYLQNASIMTPLKAQDLDPQDLVAQISQFKGPPLQLFETLKIAPNQLFQTLAPILDQHEGALLRKLVLFLKFALTQDLDPAAQEILPVVLQRLDGLKEIARDIKKSERQLLITTLTSDPRLLLTVGDLVQTGSCLNYKTGGEIQALPSYVMDANLQVILNFALRPADFASAADFAWVESNLSILDVQLTARQEFIFSGANKTVTSKIIPNAYRRNIIRLGFFNDNGRPALLTERSYKQTHWAETQFENQTRSLLSWIRNDLHIEERSGEVTFGASRNPAGTYSDYVKGSRIGQQTVFLDHTLAD